ncbi:hypothetical protein ACQUJT_24420, partial [Ralstonia pseudosolanacearum]
CSAASPNRALMPSRRQESRSQIPNEKIDWLRLTDWHYSSMSAFFHVCLMPVAAGFIARPTADARR